MSANDPDDYIRREIDWIAVPLREQRPFLASASAPRCSPCSSRARGAASARPRADRLLPDPPHRGGARALPTLAGSCLSLASRGIRASRGRELLAEGSDFRSRPSNAATPSASVSSRRDLRDDVRWTTRGHARLEMPGARPRHHHFADRAVHDVTERAWLKHFIGDWLTRPPIPVLAQAAE